MKKHFSENLKNLRKEHNWTQTELANKVFVHKAIISNYENSSRMPSLDVLIQLSEIFNVSIDYLLGIERENTNDKEQYINISGLNKTQRDALEQIIKAFRE